MAIFVDGVNIAHVPGTSLPVSVNTINGGDATGPNAPIPATNPQFYVDNHDPMFSAMDPYAASAPVYNIQYDGTTANLTAQTSISANVTYHIKIVIADVADKNFDSAIFIRAQVPCP